jgi:hypothetical protein
MHLGSFVVAAGGVFGLLGMGGMFLGAVLDQGAIRRRAFRAGSVAMGLGGLTLMLGGLSGVVGSDEFFGGLMMLLFGSGSDLTNAVGGAPSKTNEPAL